MNREASLFESLSKIRVVQFIAKEETVDYGEVIMAVWSWVRYHTEFTWPGNLANLSKDFRRGCDVLCRGELHCLVWASWNRPSRRELVEPNNKEWPKLNQKNSW